MSDFHSARFGVGGTAARRTLGTAFLAVLCLLAAQGCGGGSNGGTTPTDLCGEFTSARSPAPGQVVSRIGADSTCQLVKVEIVATDIDDVAAFSADVTYDPSFAAFVNLSVSGSALTSDGAQLAIIADELVLGQLTIGISRVSQTGIDVSGTGLVAALFFVVSTAQTDSGQFTISDECLLGGNPPNPKPGLVCSGGSLQVR